MGQIDVAINGKNYRIGCEDGEEQRVTDLARMVDGHVGDLVEQVGQVGDTRLLVMAALLVADELVDLRDSANLLAEEEPEADSEASDRYTALIENLAKRIETVAGRLDGA